MRRLATRIFSGAKRCIICVLCALCGLSLCKGICEGSAPKTSASGYLKELWQYSRSPLDRRPYALSVSRARLSLAFSRGPLQAHADYDQEVLAGGFFRTMAYRQAGLGEPAPWLDMEQTISTSATSIWRHRLYRGWIGLETDEFTLRAGRQRIAWGTGKLWNPTDSLNPISPTAIERDERTGVDALSLRAAVSELSEVSAVLAPRRRWAGSALIGRGKFNWRSFDIAALAGKAAGSTASWTAGGEFTGPLGEGTVYGEWSYSDPETRRPFWKGVLGYQHVFTPEAPWGLREASLAAEYFHNGAGTTSIHRYNPAILLAGDEVALAKDYAGLVFSKELHPLLKLDMTLLANLDDSSHSVAPGLQWNALDDLYLSASMQRFGGGRRAEFGRLPNLLFLQAQFYF